MHVYFSEYKDYSTINHIIIEYSHSGIFHQFLRIFFVYILNVIFSCFQERKQAGNPGA